MRGYCSWPTRDFWAPALGQVTPTRIVQRASTYIHFSFMRMCPLLTISTSLIYAYISIRKLYPECSKAMRNWLIDEIPCHAFLNNFILAEP
ncbi:hypothetical protein T01_10567 [Trichinella spiralis]|uniref:Uncharacterized protein n=1 Tax=Trichinella spiralis TaxID=6334 RepID=A0A0V1BH46_TRISP|nr:hypothetical protein T01_10567 [Trichinella spiralis]